MKREDNLCQNCFKESVDSLFYCPNCGSSYGDILYQKEGSSLKVIRPYRKDIERILIPSSFGGEQVTSISKGAFKDCHNLTSLTLEEGMKVIEEEAFRNCEGLLSLSIPSSIKVIQKGAFYNCSSLKEITFMGNPSKNMPYSRMRGLGQCTCPICMSSTSIVSSIASSSTPHKGLEVIDEYAFAYNSSLSSLYIPEGIKELRAGCFSYCSSLVKVYLPSSLTFLLYPFHGCNSLKEIHLNMTKDSLREVKGYLSLDEGNKARIYCVDGEFR